MLQGHLTRLLLTLQWAGCGIKQVLLQLQIMWLHNPESHEITWHSYHWHCNALVAALSKCYCYCKSCDLTTLKVMSMRIKSMETQECPNNPATGPIGLGKPNKASHAIERSQGNPMANCRPNQHGQQPASPPHNYQPALRPTKQLQNVAKASPMSYQRK